jgi:hypothetical protein
MTIPAAEDPAVEPAPTVGRSRAAILARLWTVRSTRYVLAFAFFAAAITIVFHAVLLHPGNHILFGFSDGTSQIRDYWTAAAQHKTPFTLTHDAYDGAPEGRDLAPAIQVANLFQPAFVWSLRGVVGLVGAWNAFLFLGLIATAMATFAFLDWLGCSFGAAVFGAYVATLNPWAIERAFAGHVAFLHGWVYIALTAALIRTRSRRSYRSAVVAGTALATCFYMASYDGLFASVLLLVFFMVELFRLRVARRRTVEMAVLAFATTAVLLTPVLFLYARERTAVQAQAQHAVTQLATYGASPLAYLIPSSRNPVFSFMYALHPNDFTEQTLFYGYTTIILAIVGVVRLRRRDPWLRDPRRWWTAIFFAVLIPTAFVLSLPRVYVVGSLHIYMPSAVLGEITTFWRVYARFGILVGLGLAVVAALTLTSLARRDRRWHLLAPVALAAVACLEFLPGDVKAFSTTAQPPYSSWLARHPGGIVATYPPALDQDPGIKLSGRDFWYQKLDGHPRFAYYGPGTIDTYANALRLLSRYPTDPLTPGILATEGVRYAVVHDDVYRAQQQQPPKLDPAHFHLVARLANTRIYRVTGPRLDLHRVVAEHAVELAEVQGLKAPSVEYASGFNQPETYKGSVRRWLENDGRLEVDNESSRVDEVLITGLAFSNARPRLLQIEDAHGRVLAAATIPTFEVPLSLGPLHVPPGRSTFVLHATPGPTQLSATDKRYASVFILLQLQPVPDYAVAP